MEPPEINYKRQILIWTKEMDDYITYYLDRRKSFKFISEKLGITRNAVIGRVHRLKSKKNGK